MTFTIDKNLLTCEVDITQKDLDEQLSTFNFKNKFRRFHGFNTSRDKSLSEFNSYFMTDYFSGYIDVVDKKTNLVIKKAIYKPLFESLNQAFYFAKQQRQVFAGLNHTRRDIIVVDVDDNPCFNSECQAAIIQDIFMKCSQYGLDNPSYVEFHKDSGHYQIGWYMEPYFRNYGVCKKITLEYRSLLIKLAEIFNGDLNFKGGNIKNPYHEKNIAYFFETQPVNPKKFITTLLEDQNSRDKAENSNYMLSFFTPTKEMMKLYYFDDLVQKSRNCYAYRHSILWVFNYMKNHEARLPSKSDIEKIFIQYEYESLKYNGKDSIEDFATIQRSVEGVYNFCAQHFNIKKTIQVGFSEEVALKRRLSSIETRQAVKAVKFFKARYLKNALRLSQKKIALALKCTQPTIHNILESSEDECRIFLEKYVNNHERNFRYYNPQLFQESLYILNSLKFPVEYPLSIFFNEDELTT